MAVTAIWKVKNRLDHVIDYTTNPQKTSGGDYKELHNVLDYIEADYKTEEQLYVSGINCSPETAYEEMIITKKQYHKEDGIIAFHAFQSFAEGEVSPEVCHEIGVRLANEMWGDRFEIVVSTHLNTNHYHNHFVINSVSFKDGKRYYDKRSTYAEFRNLSDSLCEEYGLSVVKNMERKKYNINYNNYSKQYYKYNNYYKTAKEDLDRAIAMAYSYHDFEQLLKTMNYHITYRYDKLTIRREPYKKNIRVSRCFGDNYSNERIRERIEIEHAPRIPFIDVYRNNKYYRKYDYKKEKPKGIYALYLHYCYLLNVIPKSNPYRVLPASIREDSRKMDQISKEIKLLVEENLKTDEQFFSFKEKIENNLNSLLEDREKLWYQYHHSGDKKELYLKITSLKNDIDKLRNTLKLCEGIELRIPKIERNIEEFIIDTGKESEKNEYIKRSG